MSDQEDQRRFLEAFAAKNGAHANQNNGVYVRGQRYSFAKKLEVAAAHQFADASSHPFGRKVSSISKNVEHVTECRL